MSNHRLLGVVITACSKALRGEHYHAGCLQSCGDGRTPPVWRSLTAFFTGSETEDRFGRLEHSVNVRLEPPAGFTPQVMSVNPPATKRLPVAASSFGDSSVGPVKAAIAPSRQFSEQAWYPD